MAVSRDAPRAVDIGRTLGGRYRLVAPLGTGASATVYLADDRLLARQVAVSDTQEAARAVLFRSRQVVDESTSTGRRLVLTFVDAVDLYERATATFLDYEALRRDFGASGVLGEVAALLRDRKSVV